MSELPQLRVGDIVDLLHRRFPPSTAQDWDSVGLVCGDPRVPVSRVLWAVDPHHDVATEAIEREVQLVITHHPLLLRGVHAVRADDPITGVIHRLIRANIALLACHTNADIAENGVSEALIGAFGITSSTPLDPAPMLLDRHVVLVPEQNAETVFAAMCAAGAGGYGDKYEAVAHLALGTGRFRPVGAAQPAVGQVGVDEVVDEVRLDTMAPRSARAAVRAAVRATHPYEVVNMDVLEIADTGESSTGLGRIGQLPEPLPLREFVDLARRVLPDTSGAFRVVGDPDALVQRVAVCGGSGDSLLAAATRAGADVYVTSDLKHHRVLDHRAAGGCAVVDVPHWAGEWPWLPVAAELLSRDVSARGATVESLVSTRITDPWSWHVAASAENAANEGNNAP